MSVSFEKNITIVFVFRITGPVLLKLRLREGSSWPVVAGVRSGQVTHKWSVC